MQLDADDATINFSISEHSTISFCGKMFGRNQDFSKVRPDPGQLVALSLYVFLSHKTFLQDMWEDVCLAEIRVMKHRFTKLVLILRRVAVLASW